MPSLHKSARVRIVYSGSAKTLHCVVAAGNLVLGEMDFSPQRGYELEVPARQITVELRDDRDTWKRIRAVTPSAGELLDVEFD